MRYSELFRDKKSPYWYVYEIDDDIRIEREDEGETRRLKHRAKYRKVSTKCTERRQAERWVRERETAGSRVSVVSALDAVSSFLLSRQAALAEQTSLRYKVVLTYFFESLDNPPIHLVRTSDIERAFTKRKIAPSSRNLEITILRLFFKWCLARKHVRSNPMDNIEFARVTPRKRNILSVDDEERLLSFLDRATIARRTNIRRDSYLFILTALRTGLRPGAITELRWSHISFVSDADTPNGRISIPAEFMKGNRPWTLPMTKDLSDELMAFSLKGRNADDRVFNLKRPPSSALRYALRELGLPNMRVHDLRGTFLTRLAKSTDIKTLQDVAGHTRPEITLTYYVQAPESRKLEALRRTFGGGQNDDNRQSCNDL